MKRIKHITDHAPPLAIDSKTSSFTISAPSTVLAEEWSRRIQTALAPGAKVRVQGKTISMRVIEQKDGQLLLEVCAKHRYVYI